MDSQRDRVGPFAEAVAVTLRELAGVEATPERTWQSTGPVGFGDVTAFVRLATAGGNGYFALSFATATAIALARRILDGAAEIDDGIVGDCAGELVNVAAGQAKALLHGSPDHFTFSTPAVTAGPPAVPAVTWGVVSFVSEVGPFHLHLSLPG